MDEIMHEIYCIVDDRVGQGYGRDEETKALEDIHDEALFRAAVSLGAEMAGPKWGMQAAGASGG